ncbi:DUF3631 domain-containing protein [Trichlorobacter lovleyi]|uniref:DUF3631 domain-containing protein n=1 Tax=Trichlorobacter lovleyi TaxID=313985 RepID=UPI0023EFC017|nr:DUF3631 domain-containing protein [Trichlorobacter lovleyi]
MKPKINNFKLAIKRSGMKPPTEIVADGTRHKFTAGEDKMGHPIHGYYITKDGIGLYWSKGLGISQKWSSQKVEQMTKPEQQHYKKILLELKRVRDMVTAKTGSSSKSDKQHSSHNKGTPVVKRKNEDLPSDRVAKRLLTDCITVVDKRSKVKTLKLLDLLNSSEDMPWYVFRSGQPIGPYHLSHMLAQFGIKSGNIRFKSGIAKGFYCEQFTEAVHRA